MKVSIHVPKMLREFCGDRSELFVESSTVGEALAELKRKHPALFRSICDETQTLRPHINLFVNSELINVRRPEGLRQPLSQDDELTIWTAVSGG